MPGIGKIHIVKVPCPGDELFGTGAFFRRTPEENHGSILIFLYQIVLQRHSGGIAARTQEIMPAAMTVAAFLHRLLHRAGGPLAQSGQGVILRKEANHRLP